MKKFLLTAAILTFGFGAYTLAYGEDAPAERTDCIDTMKSLEGIPFKDLSEAEQALLVAQKGPPGSIVEPYTVGIAEGSGGFQMLIIHDKDCMLFHSPVVSKEDMNTFLGRREAALHG